MCGTSVRYRASPLVGYQNGATRLRGLLRERMGALKKTKEGLQPKQHTEPLAHIGNDVGWSLRLERESPSLPIEVLDVIGEDDP